RQRVEAGLPFCRLDQAADFGYLAGVLLGEGRLVGLAALARPKTSVLRFCGRVEKANILTLGTPRGARRTAIDAGRFHRNEKLPIVGSVASDKGSPSLVIESQLRGEGQPLSSCSMPHGHGSEMNAVGLDVVLLLRQCTPVLAFKLGTRA